MSQDKTRRPDGLVQSDSGYFVPTTEFVRRQMAAASTAPTPTSYEEIRKVMLDAIQDGLTPMGGTGRFGRAFLHPKRFDNKEQSMNLHTILKAMQFGQTKRYHTEVMLKEQSVAEHVYNVMWLVRLLSPASMPSRMMLMACLEHDAGERRTGDMPGPFKAEYSLDALLDTAEAAHLLDATEGGPLAYEGLTSEEKELLAFCDRLELVLYNMREIELGNRTLPVRKMVGSGIAKLRAMSETPWNKDRMSLINELEERYATIL